MEIKYKLIKKIIPSYIKRNIRDAITNDGEIIHSYSQSGEDLILKRYFNRMLWAGKSGYYVDIGAFHPTKFSNTHLFYQFGWHGINIDARPGSMRLFNELRPNDINLECAISDKRERIKYYVSDDSENINTFSKEFIKMNNFEKKYVSSIKLETQTLVSIFNQYLPNKQTINFMSIDVEGFDEKVIRSNDWKKYRPIVLVVEIPAINLHEVMEHSITKLLIKYNYYPFDRTILYGEKNIGNIFFHDALKIFYPRV